MKVDRKRDCKFVNQKYLVFFSQFLFEAVKNIQFACSDSWLPCKNPTSIWFLYSSYTAYRCSDITSNNRIKNIIFIRRQKTSTEIYFRMDEGNSVNKILMSPSERLKISTHSKINFFKCCYVS